MKGSLLCERQFKGSLVYKAIQRSFFSEQQFIKRSLEITAPQHKTVINSINHCSMQGFIPFRNGLYSMKQWICP
jgi:hypothetical protein